MKNAKTMLVVAGISTMMVMTACGGKTEEDVSYAKMIPDPTTVFNDGEIEIVDPDGGTAYIFSVSNYSDSEFEAYVDGCIEMGFSEIKYQVDDAFGAYTSDGQYWAEVSIDNNDVIYVVCQKSKNYEE